jgi:3-carboxy-cis,cis-muconate cycloisomerase
VTDPLPTDGLSAHLATPLYASPAMRAAMSDRARLQRMLDFEAALARAEAAVGSIPASAASGIIEACNAELYQIPALTEAAVTSGNLAMSVVTALTDEVARRHPQAAGYVHWGATSQDVIDTALCLELRAAIDALLADLEIAIKGFTTLAGRHRRTSSVARTLMQQALPMPFGLKLAGYAAALARSRERLTRVRREALALQLGGAAGTLAALGEHGMDVAGRLAALLDLPLPDAPWHAHRDRLAEIATAFAILAGTCGKIAGDVALLMQTEVGEAFEPLAGARSGSSTMPHKRNPMRAVAALSAATMAPNLAATLLAAQVQQHERGLGGWQTEWMTFPVLALVTSGALHSVAEIAEGLEIDVEKMRANLEAGGGQIMAEPVSFALAEKLGRAEAHKLVQELSRQAARQKRPLKEVLQGDSRVKALLTNIQIEKLFIPLTYQGSAQVFIDRLALSSTLRGPRRSEVRVESRTETKPENWQEVAKPRLPVAPQLPQISETDVPSDGPKPPDEAEAKQAEPVGETQPRPDDDAPGALMAVLSRPDAEAHAASDTEGKREPS